MVRPVATAGDTGRRGRRLTRRIVISAAIVAAALWFVLIPQYGAGLRTLSTMSRISFPLIVVALLLEGLSLLSYSALTCVVLGERGFSYSTVLRIDLADLGVNHAVPGGGTVAAAVRYRLLTRAGIRGELALTAATIEITGSNLVLGGLFGLGIALSLGRLSGNGLYVVAAVATLVLLSGSAVALWLLTRHPQRAVRIARSVARRIPLLTADRAEHFVLTVAEHVTQFVTDPRRMVAAVGLAAANWGLDAASLWVLVAAFGYAVPVGPLLASYGLASIIATLPLTPGGLGLVEGVLIPALTAFGAPLSAALLGVLAWRIFEFWLPLPLAALSYGSLVLGPFRRDATSRNT